MIKTLTLMLVIFNPANDTEHEVAYGVYSYDECLMNETYINSINSPINIELKRNNLELVETHCD